MVTSVREMQRPPRVRFGGIVRVGKTLFGAGRSAGLVLVVTVYVDIFVGRDCNRTRGFIRLLFIY